MKAKGAALLVGMLLLGGTRAGATTYAVSEFTGNSTLGAAIGGSITTDGTLGPIGAANIVDWNLIGVAFEPMATTTFLNFTPSNSVIANAANITATDTALSLVLGSGPTEGDLEIAMTSSIFLDWSAVSPPDSVRFVVSGFPGASIQGFADGLTFADAKVIPTTAATPLPAALPLFATGLGGLALLGWRRKRKARAV